MFGTSRRTIFRDLQQLQTIGVPYHYDAQAGGYTIDPEFFLPPIDLNLQEALSLLLLVHRASGHLQLPFKNSALFAALKIENNLPDTLRQYCNTALKNISTRPGPQSPASHLDKTFSLLQRALVKKRKVKVKYDSFFEKKVVELTLSPYHLVYNRRAWYVMGYSSMHKSIRTFKLNRIKKLSLLDKCFVDGDTFDLADHIGRAWSMMPEGKLYNIKLRFLPKVARNVAEVQWHSTQQSNFNDDGSVILEFRVDGLGEIVWWILGYGDQVQILSPKQLRNQVIKRAKGLIRLNKVL